MTNYLINDKGQAQATGTVTFTKRAIADIVNACKNDDDIRLMPKHNKIKNTID